MSGTGYITQSGTGTNTLKSINMISNANINQTGGIISQTLGGVNAFSHYRTLGFGIIAGKNGTGTTHTYNAHNVFGLQFQYGRTSDNHCYIMSNRATGGNGAFRFQRYIGSIYLDEPLLIGDEITVNKNLSIPGGSLSCSSATLGIISQDELNTLENMNYNIKDKFQSLDEQINNLSVANNNNNLALTGISYNSSTDTTTIDNNLIVKTTNILTAFNDINFLLSGISYNSTNDTTTIDNNLIVKNTNILTALNDINFKLSGISYNQTEDLTTISNHMLLPSGNNLMLGSINVKYSIDELNTKISGITYNSTNDTTTIDNNLTVNNVLTVQGLDVKTEIENIKATYTTGVINTDELITKTLTLKDINESALQQVNNNLTIINKDINGIIDIKNNTSSYININKNTITFDNTNKIVFKKNIESTGVNTFNGKCTFNEDITVPKSIIGHTITSNNFTNTGRITSGSIFNSSELNTTDINVSNNIFVENLINHKNAIILHTTKNIISDLSLTFPLAQINILTRNNPTFVNVNVSLPSITNTNFTGQTFEFITHSNNSSLTLSSSTGSKIYNNYGIELSNIVIQIDKIEYVKFVIRGIDYWIVETKQRDNTCGYILDGTLTGRSVLNPVICSCKYLNPENGADAVVVNPGYKFKCFVDFEYLGNVEVFDNSDGLTPQYFVLNAPNYTSSIKVFYKDVLITFPNIS